MRLIDNDGIPLDAACTFARKDDDLVFTLESSSGRHGERPRTNSAYMNALRVFLERLQAVDGVILDARVDSRDTRRHDLSAAERRILRDRPLMLRTIRDVDALRRQLTAAAGSVGRSPDGNRTKRIEIIFSAATYGDDEAFVTDLVNGAPLMPASSDARAHDKDAPPPSPTRSGHIHDIELKLAIERYAMERAMDVYRRRWGFHVEDVGATEPYDIQAEQDGHRLCIEVKGSVLAIGEVELTANEVTHARDAETHLFVVDQIDVDRLSDRYGVSGGRCRRWIAWRPREHDLHPTRYRYRLPGGGEPISPID